MDQTETGTAERLIESDRVEGTMVFDESGDRVGHVKRLRIERVSGRVAYAVVDFDAFALNGGQRTVPWGALRYDVSRGGYRTGLTETDVHEAPAFGGEMHELSTREREEQLHDYFQIPPYWRFI